MPQNVLSITQVNEYIRSIIDNDNLLVNVAVKGENQYQLNVLHIAPINKSELLVNFYYLANMQVYILTHKQTC